MWYAQLTQQRLAASVRLQQLGATVLIDPQGGQPHLSDTVNQIEVLFVVDDLTTDLTTEVLLDDSVTLDDALETAYGFSADLSDDVTLDDTVETLSDVLLSLSDPLSISEGTSILSGSDAAVVMQDDLVMSDGLVIDATLGPNDFVFPDDSLLSPLDRFMDLADSLTATDTPVLNPSLVFSESVAASDAQANIIALTLQGTTQGYIDFGYFASDYIEGSGSGDFVTMTDALT